MKISCAKKTKNIIFILVAFVLLVSTLFLGMQVTKASAAETEEVIQLSIYSQHGDDSSSSSGSSGSSSGSSGSSSDVGLGHAWIVIENWTNNSYSFYNTTILPGETFSVGTWGNRKDPDTNKNHNGTWLNLEAYYQMGEISTASLTITIDESQLEIVSEKCISMNSWNVINNCSYFASKVWNAVAPENMHVNSFFFPANFPSTLKKSIQKISGYQTNRAFAYNDYTGYCTNDTYFKCIEAERIESGSSSSSSNSSNVENELCMKGFVTSFPTEYSSPQMIIDAYNERHIHDFSNQ